VSPVDQDARSGNKTHKHWAGYKGHLIVEEDSEIITAVEATPANVNDGSELKPLLSRQDQAFDLVPEELSGDKGYDSGANLEYLADQGITGNISLTVKSNNHGEDLFTRSEFVYDPQKDSVTCPAGCVASHAKRDFIHSNDQKRSGWMFQFSRKYCTHCELRSLCISSRSKVYSRTVHVSVYEPLFQQMRARMESEEGRAAYRRRYKIEHKVADLARYCGMRRCRYRGLTRAGIHTLLAAIVSNIKRMARLLCPKEDMPPLESVLVP
jgi:hypothetical protein